MVTLVVSRPAYADESLERVVEGRLLAPCCWLQTLDVHDSPLASSLRDEVRSRLQRGEAPAAVENDLVARYGAAIRAVPAGTDPRRALGVGTVAAFLACGALLLAYVLRRVKGARVPRKGPRSFPVDPYDARLDLELEEHHR